MRAIITVGVSHERNFRPYLDRWERTMNEHGRAEIVTAYRKNWPPNSPSHGEVNYAFKLYAILEARRLGATQILWLDCSCHALRSLEPLWKEIETTGYYLIHGEDRLGNWSSDDCLQGFELTRDDAMDIKLLSGTIVGLDMTKGVAQAFLGSWLAYAAPRHFNGTHKSSLKPNQPIPEEEGKRMSDDPRCQGHRADEPYTTISARRLSMKSTPIATSHFYGGYGDDGSGKCLIRSGYDL